MKRLVFSPIFCFLLITTICFVATPAMAVIVDITLSGTYTPDDPNTPENEKQLVVKLSYSDEPPYKPKKDDFTFSFRAVGAQEIDYPSPILFGEGSDNDPKTYFITFTEMPLRGGPMFTYKGHKVFVFANPFVMLFRTFTDHNDIRTPTVIPDNKIQVELLPPKKVGQLPPIKIESVDGLTRSSPAFATEDITYTLRITNTSNASDYIIIDADAFPPSLNLHYIIDPNELTLAAGASVDVILTIPREDFSQVGTYSVTVNVESTNELDVVASIITETTITVPKVIFSEFMFESEGGAGSLPQWIEVYNSSNSEVNLRGWKLQWKSLQPTPVEVTTTFDADFRIPTQQARLIVTALGRYSGSNLTNATVYQLRPEKIGEGLIIQYIQDITGGFSLKLTDPDDEIIDQIGTLSDNGEKKAWEHPKSLIEGARSSLIRRFEGGVPRSGTERRGWIRAFDTKRLASDIYYGSSSDHGTPGYRRGKPLPVELSQFSGALVKDEVVINWTTESELNNAGFNIYRSTSKTKDFHRINPKLIQGAGTTGQRTQYQFIDKTSKPDVAYYYRLEDVDLSGTRGILTTTRLRSVIAPNGKRITTWGTLKDDR